MAKTTIDRRWLPLERAARLRGRGQALELHRRRECAADLAERAVAPRDRAGEADRRAAVRAPAARAGADQGRPASAARGDEVLRPAGIRARRHPQRRPSTRAHPAGADAAELRRAPRGAHSAGFPPRRRGGRDRSGEPVRRRAAARRCGRGGGLFQAHRDRPGDGSLVAGAVEPAVPSELSRRGSRAKPCASSSSRTSWCTCAFRICRGIICGRSSPGRPALHASTSSADWCSIRRCSRCSTRLSGEGIALIDNYLFGDYIRTGRLVKPVRATSSMTATAIT